MTAFVLEKGVVSAMQCAFNEVILKIRSFSFWGRAHAQATQHKKEDKTKRKN